MTGLNGRLLRPLLLKVEFPQRCFTLKRNELKETLNETYNVKSTIANINETESHVERYLGENFPMFDRFEKNSSTLCRTVFSVIHAQI